MRVRHSVTYDFVHLLSKHPLGKLKRYILPSQKVLRGSDVNNREETDILCNEFVNFSNQTSTALDTNSSCIVGIASKQIPNLRPVSSNMLEACSCVALAATDRGFVVNNRNLPCEKHSREDLKNETVDENCTR